MTRARDLASGSGIEAGEVVPHIIPGVLYPAVAGKDLSGTALGGSYTYGTAHTDGRSYYFTDIKGSKPIKDPRIGAHFGSQRHKAKSVQLLEQETATHGENVYSVDGREWFRVVSSDIEGWNMDVGTFIGSSNHTFTTFFEIVGYFNDFNCISRTKNDRADDINVTVNGGTTRNSANTDKLGGRSTADTPLGGRYVDVGSVINHGDSDVTSDLGTTPRINTIKIEAINTGSEYWQFFGIELIAQDTSSTANKSKIQIPSQNVVSYGKKFTVSGTPHYDPFNGFTSGNLAAVQALIDTDTSLGIANWLSSSTYYRPFNGGRVVKWVDSSGNIKTSVNMMPPNAQNVGTTASNPIDLSSSQTNDDTINFNTSAIDHSLSEVAKTFNWREFGNGAANGGTSGSWADASMLKDGVDDDVAYVMDDGLTSFSAETIEADSDQLSYRFNGHDAFYITFIGTGISIEKKALDTQAGSDSFTYTLDGVAVTTYSSSNATHPKFINLAQNLPYGTHVLKVNRSNLSNVHPFWKGFTFHQPKKPPIPEDAVVLADYMLMADFVAQTGHGKEKLSKGTRCNWASRDFFYDSGSALTLEGPHTSIVSGYRVYNNNNAKQIDLPTFGHGFVARFLANTDRSSNTTYKVNDDVYDTNFNASGTYTAGNRIGTTSPNPWDTTNNDGTVTFDHNGNGTDAVEFAGIKNLELGVNKITFDDDTTDYITFDGAEIVTPIHTSSHYQSFETPFLNELVGGDRNMEQTNLVVTPDGKSWDEVTRDTSYLGNSVMLVRHDAGWQSENHWNRQRGQFGLIDCYVKDSWCSAYDRFVCLKAGMYTIEMHLLIKDSSGIIISINGSGNHAVQLHPPNETGRHEMVSTSFDYYFNRGDYVQNHGQRYGSTYTYFQIRKSRKSS